VYRPLLGNERRLFFASPFSPVSAGNLPPLATPGSLRAPHALSRPRTFITLLHPRRVFLGACSSGTRAPASPTFFCHDTFFPPTEFQVPLQQIISRDIEIPVYWKRPLLQPTPKCRGSFSLSLSTATILHSSLSFSFFGTRPRTKIGTLRLHPFEVPQILCTVRALLFIFPFLPPLFG